MSPESSPRSQQLKRSAAISERLLGAAVFLLSLVFLAQLR